MSLCHECERWPLERGDRFCGWCGAPLLAVGLARADGSGRLSQPARDYVAPGTHQLTYLLETRGSLARQTPTVERLPGGIRCPIEAGARAGEWLLGVTLPDLPTAGSATVELLVRGEAEQRSLQLDLWPRPTLQPRLSSDGLQTLEEGVLRATFTDARAEQERLLVRLALPEAPVVLRAFAVDEGGGELRWDRDGVLQTDALELRVADVGREVGLQRELPIEISRRGPWERGHQRELTVVLAFDGLPHYEQRLALVQRRRTGGDFQPEAIELPHLFSGRAEVVACHLANHDDYPLVLESVSCDAPWIRLASYRADARPEALPPLQLPLSLPAADPRGGQPGGSLDFAVVLDGKHPGFPARGPIAATLNFSQAGGGRSLLNVRVAEVKQPASLSSQGYLAIDFGTTNTCCALKLEDRPVEVIPFGRGGKSSLPSVIFFEDLREPSAPKVVVGDPALARAKARGERALVRAFKRRIGDETKIQCTDPEGNAASFTAEELSAIFLREVLGEVREHIASSGDPITIDAIFFTYPVLFSPRQVGKLAEVFRSLGVTEVIPALDEATAGAVQAIHRWATDGYRALGAAAGAAPATTEYVLNYDFGGGTIDIALLEVGKDFAESQVTVTPIGVTGLYRFGGEDVTVLVRQMIVRRIEKKLRRRCPRFELPCGDLAHPPGLYAVKKENNARLGFLAEKAKIELFASGEYAIHSNDPDLDQLWIDRGEGAGPERTDVIKNPLFAGLDEVEATVTLRRADVERVIAPRLASSIARAYNLWRTGCAQGDGAIKPLARVLLTGRSSGIPLVKQLICERLGVPEHAVVHDPASAKEVVAQGACYYRRLWSVMMTGLRLLLGEVEQRVLMPIGIERIDYSDSVFFPVFDASTRMEPRQDSAGRDCLFASRELAFGLAGPIATLKMFRSLDYVDPIPSPGKDLVARFDIRADDPFFADWTAKERARFPVTVQLWRAIDGGEHTLEVVVAHPRSGQSKVFRSLFSGDLSATVGEAEEAAGLPIDELDPLDDRRQVGNDGDGWS